MRCPGLMCGHQSVVLENHLLELEECLRSWENSISHSTCAQRGIQVQHGGSTCLDRPCERSPKAMLGVTMLRLERSEVKLAQFGIL
jgi:hypothetical protein